MANYKKNSILSCLTIITICNWNATCVSATLCRTQTQQIGRCSLYENCSALHNAMLFSNMFNVKDCQNSGLIGAVVCCPRIARQSTTITATIAATQPTVQPAAFPSRFDIFSNALPTADPNNSSLKTINPDGLTLLNKNRCGRILTDRVANGVNAGLDELPWLAMLLYGEALKPLCGGSVITERWVLTAAHCIQNDLKQVRLGEHTVSTERDCITDTLCVTHEDFLIEKSITHPEYNSSVYYKDIALIKLRAPISIQTTINIKPICVPTSPEEYEIVSSSDIIIAGWGLKEDGQPADVLQKGFLKSAQLDVCRNTYSRYLVDDSKICSVAGANDTVSCRGDSGGPIFRKTRYRTTRGYYRERYAQIGLVSTGYMYKCGGLTRVPFMFENVTDSIAWITQAVLS